TDPDLAGSHTVTVSVDTSAGDHLTVTLNETATPGVFAADVPTQVTGTIIPNDGILQVLGGQALTATYVDAIDDLGLVNQSRVVKLAVKAGKDGSISGTPSIE